MTDPFSFVPPSPREIVDPEFLPGGRLHGELARNIRRTLGVELDRNEGRLFFPGDCLLFDCDVTDDEYIDLHEPCDPSTIIGTTRIGPKVGRIELGETFIVLSAFRDDQRSSASSDPYPVVSMLVVCRSGAGWVFIDLSDEIRSFRLVWSSPAERIEKERHEVTGCDVE